MVAGRLLYEKGGLAVGDAGRCASGLAAGRTVRVGWEEAQAGEVSACHAVHWTEPVESAPACHESVRPGPACGVLLNKGEGCSCNAIAARSLWSASGAATAAHGL